MKLAERPISVIAPWECLNCSVEGSLLCLNCRESISQPIPSRCFKCRASTEMFKTCPACRKSSRLGHVWVATELKDLSKVLLYKFKFERAQSAAGVIAGQMASIIPNLPSDTLVVPIPTATSRVRSRGYDHTEVLAKELSKLLKLEYRPFLVRLNQARQVGATRDQRRVQLDGAYRLINANLLKGRKILLVDDVVTTGSTLEEAARTLRMAGSGPIVAAVFAEKQ
jgi:competence protein ComFC